MISYLLYPLSVVLIPPKHLDGKYSAILIVSSPNVGESTRCNGVIPYCEARSDPVRVRE